LQLLNDGGTARRSRITILEGATAEHQHANHPYPTGETSHHPSPYLARRVARCPAPSCMHRKNTIFHRASIPRDDAGLCFTMRSRLALQLLHLLCLFGFQACFCEAAPVTRNWSTNVVCCYLWRSTRN
jgi:hypothetical protein